MLVYASKLMGTPILSMQASAQIARLNGFVIDPDSLKTLAFLVAGAGSSNILPVKSVREYSNYGMVVDSHDDLAEPGEVIKVDKILSLHFNLPGLKVETKKGTKLGKVLDFTMTSDDFTVQQIVVKRPLYKALLDAELLIPRQEIVEVTDDKIIVKDEEKVIRARAMNEDFIPNFVNPFRKTAVAATKTEEN